jgi:hypothetical protein
MCVQVHDHTLALAMALGKDSKSFIPEYLSGDAEPDGKAAQ